jgi:hypothetical protein
VENRAGIKRGVSVAISMHGEDQVRFFIVKLLSEAAGSSSHVDLCGGLFSSSLSFMWLTELQVSEES